MPLNDKEKEQRVYEYLKSLGSLNMPPANDVKSSFDVSDSTDTVAGTPLPAEPVNPFKIESVESKVPSWETMLEPKKSPLVEEIAASLPQPQAPTESPINIPTKSDLQRDQKRRDLLEQGIQDNNVAKMFAAGFASAGDAVLAGEGKSPSGLKDTLKNFEESEQEARKTLEVKFGTDPNSDLSRVAQSAAERLLQKKPGALADMSANQISAVFPVWKEALNNEESRELKKIQMEAVKSSKQDRLDASKENAFYRVGKDLTNDHRYKEMAKQKMALNAVEGLVKEVRSGNTVATSAIGTKLARAMGEVGVLTEQDVIRYMQSGWIPQKVGDKLKRLVLGKPTDMTLNEIEDISKAIKASFDASVKPIQEDYTIRMARSYNIPEEEAAALLNVPYHKNIPEDKAEKSESDPLGIL